MSVLAQHLWVFGCEHLNLNFLAAMHIATPVARLRLKITLKMIVNMLPYHQKNLVHRQTIFPGLTCGNPSDTDESTSDTAHGHTDNRAAQGADPRFRAREAHVWTTWNQRKFPMVRSLAEGNRFDARHVRILLRSRSPANAPGVILVWRNILMKQIFNLPERQLAPAAP